MARIAANDMVAMIFFSLLGVGLIGVGLFVLAMALFLGAWGYAALEVLALGIPVFLFGIACAAIAIRTARHVIRARRVANHGTYRRG